MALLLTPEWTQWHALCGSLDPGEPKVLPADWRPMMGARRVLLAAREIAPARAAAGGAPARALIWYATRERDGALESLPPSTMDLDGVLQV
ncbi:MAG TPA: hypothetical protein VID73_02965 [Ktedonobacterales bacterium]|jgi:hypothetical protein